MSCYRLAQIFPNVKKKKKAKATQVLKKKQKESKTLILFWLKKHIENTLEILINTFMVSNNPKIVPKSQTKPN
jgi:hypothetical protein